MMTTTNIFHFPIVLFDGKNIRNKFGYLLDINLQEILHVLLSFPFLYNGRLHMNDLKTCINSISSSSSISSHAIEICVGQQKLINGSMCFIYTSLSHFLNHIEFSNHNYIQLNTTCQLKKINYIDNEHNTYSLPSSNDDEEEDNEFSTNYHLIPTTSNNNMKQQQKEEKEDYSIVEMKTSTVKKRKSIQQYKCAICTEEEEEGREFIDQPCGNLSHSVCSLCFERMIHEIISKTTAHPRNLCKLLNCFGCYDCSSMKKLSNPEIITSFLKTNAQKTIFQQQVWLKWGIHPGKECIRCPICFEQCLLSMERLDRNISLSKSTVVHCRQCRNGFCYHCKSTNIQRNNAICKCLNCDGDDNQKYLLNYNPYYSKSVASSSSATTIIENDDEKKNNSMIITPSHFLFEHKDITLDVIEKKVLETLEVEHLFIKCPCCQVVLKKTVDCNCLTHCGVEICYVCGRSGMPKLPQGHFSSKGCPRWDSDKFWKEDKGLLCEQDICYNETHDCSLIEHKQGRINVLEYIKSRRIQFLLSTTIHYLSVDQRVELQQKLYAKDHFFLSSTIKTIF